MLSYHCFLRCLQASIGFLTGSATARQWTFSNHWWAKQHIISVVVNRQVAQESVITNHKPNSPRKLFTCARLDSVLQACQTVERSGDSAPFFWQIDGWKNTSIQGRVLIAYGNVLSNLKFGVDLLAIRNETGMSSSCKFWLPGIIIYAARALTQTSTLPSSARRAYKQLRKDCGEKNQEETKHGVWHGSWEDIVQTP